MRAIASSLIQNFGAFVHNDFHYSLSEPFTVDKKLAHHDDMPLAMHDLNVSIKGTRILKNVNLEIPLHKITCIIGPSGCGKSTLLRTLNRLNDDVEGMRVSGAVNLGSQNILTAGGQQLSELRRNVGLVPQRPCPLPMSIYDNVVYGCRIHGVHNKRRLHNIAQHYLKAVGLWDEVKDRLKSPASRLSGGQQQRLCLARSLAVEPSYLLADESTSALDPISSRKVEELFTELKKDYTIVMVTHTLQQALRIADHVVFMYLGEVVEQGDAKDVLHHPKKELTQRYLQGAFS